MLELASQPIMKKTALYGTLKYYMMDELRSTSGVGFQRHPGQEFIYGTER